MILKARGEALNEPAPFAELHRRVGVRDSGSSTPTSGNDGASKPPSGGFGADVDHRECDSRIDRPETAEFGVDDHPEVTRSSENDRSNLFAETTVDHQTLTGDDTAIQCPLR